MGGEAGPRRAGGGRGPEVRLRRGAARHRRVLAVGEAVRRPCPSSGAMDKNTKENRSGNPARVPKVTPRLVDAFLLITQFEALVTVTIKLTK